MSERAIVIILILLHKSLIVRHIKRTLMLSVELVMPDTKLVKA